MCNILIKYDNWSKLIFRREEVNMKETKILKLFILDIICATRGIVRFVVKKIVEQKYNAVSLENIDSISRSFLDELFVLTKINKISISEIPTNIQPLYDIIEKSHNRQKMYAPNIKVRISNRVFA